jgi:hypothetical protein
VRISDAERRALEQRLDEDGIVYEVRDHDIAVGVFFRDPDGRRLEAITYRGGGDPRS